MLAKTKSIIVSHSPSDEIDEHITVTTAACLYALCAVF